MLAALLGKSIIHHRYQALLVGDCCTTEDGAILKDVHKMLPYPSHQSLDPLDAVTIRDRSYLGTVADLTLLVVRIELSTNAAFLTLGEYATHRARPIILGLAIGGRPLPFKKLSVCK